MKKLILATILLIVNCAFLQGQSNTLKKPKLVVGIIVDLMRFDYLYKYEEKYGDGGFKKILKDGFNFKNAHYNYIPTVTAAGHASIYTGTTPSVHGIIGNNWFNRYENKTIGNVKDSSEKIVGSLKENDKGVSPKNLLSTTISDQLRLGSNFNSKVISISFKDRGAILPGGQTANAAYWHDWQTSPGYFVTSSFYMKSLPKWVTNFNKSNRSSNYLDTIWNTLYPISSYTESDADDNPHELILRGKTSPTFPYNFKTLRKTYREVGAEYQMLWISPNGNTLLTDFAIEAIKNEKLGIDNTTDLINISYSVPDVAGHTFGSQSVEVEDIYIRLDKDLENLIHYLDKNIGKGEYLLFLSSDHGAIPTASYLNKYKLPTGIANIKNYKDSLSNYLNTKYGKNSWIQNFDGENVYLNKKLIAKSNLQLQKIQQEVANYLIDFEGINTALTAFQLQNNEYTFGTKSKLQKGYHPKRSGDVLLEFAPGFVQSPETDISKIKGTTHGSGYAYDTHVPVLWYGWRVPKGESVRKVSIIDIAPSLAMFLNLQLPSGSTGLPLTELFKE